MMREDETSFEGPPGGEPGEPGERREEDQKFLDELLDRALELLEDGESADLDELLGGRAHLRAEAEEVLSLARGAAVVAPRELPVLSGYEILRELGQGGMGTVYLARRERLGGRPVALKVLPPAAALSPRARRRFLSEARALARLQHPHVVAVHDVIEEETLTAYAMEWVEGTSLARLIEHLRGLGRAPEMADLRALLGTSEEEIPDSTVAVYLCRLGIAIGRALEAVHGAGLVHRDVKPSNILLRRDGTPNCFDAWDGNGDGVIDIGDPIFLLAYLFTDGPPPPAPFPGCGNLGLGQDCDSFAACP